MESLGFPVSMLDGRTFTACKNVFFRVYLMPDFFLHLMLWLDQVSGRATQSSMFAPIQCSLWDIRSPATLTLRSAFSRPHVLPGQPSFVSLMGGAMAIILAGSLKEHF